MNRVYIKTYGCQMNERDSEAVAAMLRDRGYSIVDHEMDADTVLLNTCSVRDQAEQKAIGKAGHLAKRKRTDPNFVLGVIGCMAQNRGEELLQCLPDLDLVVGTQKFHRVPEHLEAVIRSQRARGPKPSSIVDLEAEADSQETIREHHQGKRQVSAFVSIMQGCNMRCSFCIVPKTRGDERSRTMESIVEEVRQLADQGTREVTLLGQIVTSYGRDLYKRVRGKGPFVQLLEKVQEIDGIERIRFTSPHPRGFREDLMDAYVDLPKLCEYVHLPLQSGSDAILKSMKRPYTVDAFRNIVDGLRERVSDIYLSTDIIVGFPGETGADFEATRRVFAEVGFEMAFVFKYSPRSGTVAADMADNVPTEVKEKRNQELLTILGEQSLRRNRSLVGTDQEVLVEGPARRGEGKYIGRTRGHRKVILDGNERLVGELIPVHIESATVSTLHGLPVLAGLNDQKLSSTLRRSA